jgi:voltage-gated potassium channel Kch
MIATIGITALGAVILLLTYIDIWATVLHPSLESPLSNRFHRTVWRAVRLIARRVRRPHRFLNAALPLLIGGLILLWLLMLLIGFALIYYPWLGDPGAFETPPDYSNSWFDALYVSGTTLFTLGYGDITPLTTTLRAVAIIEAGSGMATISLAVTYVLAVYPTLTRLRIRATALDAEVAGQVNGLPLLRRYLRHDGRWNGELDERLRELALELLELAENHEAHPILYYSHPPRVQQSILRMLLTTQHLIALLRYGLSPEQHPDLVRAPQLLLLEQSFGYSLRRLSSSLHTVLTEQHHDATTRAEMRDAFKQICAELEEMELTSALQHDEHPVPVLAEAEQRETRPGNGDDPALDHGSRSPLDAYVAFRLATDPHIDAYATASGYTLEEARRDDSAIWGETKHAAEEQD